VDFSIAKDAALHLFGESGKLEFRAEFFNILNRANFAVPNTTVYAGTQDLQAPLAAAGKITSTGSRTARQMQFALKLLF